MSGHSKWANIKNKKEKADNARGKIFTKIGREIAIAVKEGGSDPNNNSKLRDVIAKAKANNMPNDNISRSIKKAAGEMGSVNYEEITYEGYGPGGTAIIVEVVVSWMFDKKGLIVVERSASIDEDELMMEALDAGAEDFNALDDVYEIYTAPTDFSVVREALEAKGLSFLSAEIGMFPQNTVDATKDEELVEKIEKMLERFDDDDDVQDVYHNATLPEEEEEE